MVHSLNLAVGPEMVDLGDPVFDFTFMVYAVEDMCERPLVLFAVGELDAVVGEYDIDVVGHGSDEVA